MNLNIYVKHIHEHSSFSKNIYIHFCNDIFFFQKKGWAGKIKEVFYSGLLRIS
ncbi:hypothetical protein ACJX0J_030579, partial [Zea mays]